MTEAEVTNNFGAVLEKLAEIFRLGGRKPAVYENILTAFYRSHYFRLSNS